MRTIHSNHELIYNFGQRAIRALRGSPRIAAHYLKIACDSRFIAAVTIRALDRPQSEPSRVRKNRFAYEKSCRGRDAGYPAPPAQIRTGSIAAYGSYLGWMASKRKLGWGWRILALGIH